MILNKEIAQCVNNEKVASRRLGGVVVNRNENLRYSHYTVSDSITNLVEVYITDELRMAGLPFRELKRLAAIELKRIKDDPFGETSIDPHVSDADARAQRAVNRLRESIQEAVTFPIAVKSSVESERDTYYGKEDLIDQFLFMRELQFVSQERLSDEQKALLEFLPVYGAVKSNVREFLIMKRIVGATEIHDVVVPFQTYGWAGSGDPDSELALVTSEHEDLIEAIGFKLPPKLLRYRYITMAFNEVLGVYLHDLAGRNVLYYSENGNRKYAVIDQVRHRVE